VYDQIKALSDSVGGFGHLLMFGQGGFLDHKDTVANITLFAKEIVPRLRELNPERSFRFGSALSSHHVLAVSELIDHAGNLCGSSD
jgi:hypothetical protein